MHQISYFSDGILPGVLQGLALEVGPATRFLGVASFDVDGLTVSELGSAPDVDQIRGYKEGSWSSTHRNYPERIRITQLSGRCPLG